MAASSLRQAVFLCLPGQRRGHTCIFSRLRIITTCLPSFPAGRSAPQQHQSVHPALVPPAGETEMRMHLGVWGYTPAGVQRAAPSGAVRIGRPSGEERPPRRRPLRRGAPAAEAAPPARSARCGGGPSGEERPLRRRKALGRFQKMVFQYDLPELVSCLFRAVKGFNLVAILQKRLDEMQTLV